MPEPRSVGCTGYTHVDCNGEGIPRLFLTEAKAKGALREWLKGVHVGVVEKDYDDDGWGTYTYSYTVIEINEKHDRIKKDMQVIPVMLTDYTRKQQLKDKHNEPSM